MSTNNKSKVPPHVSVGLTPNRSEKITLLGHLKAFGKQWDAQILVVIPLIQILIFSYIPLYGLVMAFQEYRLGDFPGFSEWVGFKHISRLISDETFGRVIFNTIGISVLKLLINFPLPILFAVLVNEIRSKHFKKSVQTISYLPHFISWVVAATIIMDFLSLDHGTVNELLLSLGVIKEPISFMTQPKYFWGILIVTDIWKELGWNAIIFTAAISAVDQQMYEAAAIDGASRLQRMWHITVKAIKPTILILFIFNVGGVMNANFDQIMLLTNQMNNTILRDVADVLDTYVYRVGLREGRFSFATAAALFKSILNFALLIAANTLVARIDDDKTSVF